MKAYVFAAVAALLFGGLASGQVVIIDDVFGDGNPETNTDGTVAPGIDGSYYVVAAGGGVDKEGAAASTEMSEAGGSLKFDPSGNGNWSRGELITKQVFPLPTAGNTRTLSWTIGPVTPSVTVQVPGDDYRIQLNATNAARTQDTAGNGVGRDSERWVLDGTDSGAATISLDMYFADENAFIAEQGDPAGEVALAQLWEKDSTFPASSNGTQLNYTGDPAVTDLNFQIADWDFTSVSNTFSLTMSDTGYTWSDSVTGFEFSADYTDQMAADFADGYWAYMHGQNNNEGRGSHELTRFMVTETGGATGLACDSDADMDCDITDLDALYAVFGASGGNGQFDFDADGDVDATDIDAWLTAASVPAGVQLVTGDIDLNGAVTSSDLGALLNNFGTDSGVGWGGGDINGDGNVDSTDLGGLLNNFGFASAAASAVPEPSSAMLLLVALSGVVSLCRKRRVCC